MKFTPGSFVFLLLFFNCSFSPEQMPLPSCELCHIIPLSQAQTVEQVSGSIIQQNIEPRQIFKVEEGSIVWVDDQIYSLLFVLDNRDRLELMIARTTQDFNYHFPVSSGENQILEVYLNDEKLRLKGAVLSLQPKMDTKSFTAVINIHTQQLGDWNGTVRYIPIVERRW